MKRRCLLQLNIIAICFLSICVANAATLTTALSVESSSTKETGIGSLFADSVKDFTKSDVAIIAASEIKVHTPTIPAGELSIEMLKSYISFSDDYIIKLDIKGSDILSALETSVSVYPRPNMGFLQVSGLTLEYDSSKPADSKIISVKINGNDINTESIYTVAMTNSLANGALGYWRHWNIKQLNTKYDKSLADVLDLFLSSKKSLNYSSTNRIIKK